MKREHRFNWKKRAVRSYRPHRAVKKNKSGPAGFGWPFWHVTISDSHGAVIYRDHEESFPGQFNVHWMWDDQDRVWLYDSDDGSVYFYELTEGKWKKESWGYGNTRQIERDISPPDSLCPHYAKD
jgi:hypothetical protein